jgi:hypothetical protein
MAIDNWLVAIVMVSGYMDISYMGIGYGYWLLAYGYSYWLHDKVTFGLFFEFGVRTSFMWVWMFGFEVFQVYGQGFSSMIWFLGSWIFEVKHGLYLCKILELKIKIYN